MDATLRELTSLVREVNPESRKKGTYSFWNYLGPGLLFDLLCSIAPGGRFRSGAGLGIVLLGVVVVGVALEAREVRWSWGAAVEEICIKFWIVPKPDRSSTSAGLSLRPPRTLTSVETRSCGLSLVIKRHLISLSLPSDLLRIPAHPKAADVGEVDFIEEAEVILRNVIKSCLMEVLQVSSWWLLLTRPGSLPLGSDWSGLELERTLETRSDSSIVTSIGKGRRVS